MCVLAVALCVICVDVLSMCCDFRSPWSSAEPAPVAPEDPAPIWEFRDSSGWPCPAGSILSPNLGSHALVRTPLCPAPTLPHPTPGLASFQRGRSVVCKGGGCLWLSLSCPLATHRLAPAEPSVLPGSASVGNLPGHLYSRLRVNCFISRLPIHLRTYGRVTLTHNFTPVAVGGGRDSQGPGVQVEGYLRQDCGHHQEDAKYAERYAQIWLLPPLPSSTPEPKCRGPSQG